MSGLSLADQLKALSAPSRIQALDPESAYTSLDSLPTKGDDNDPNEGKEHYLDVGPSRLRMQLNGDPSAGGTLRGEKYAGVTRGRVRIFDDDEDEEEDEDENPPFGAVDDDDEDNDEDEDEEDEDEDEDEYEDGEDEGEEDEDEEEEVEEEEEEQAPRKNASSGKTLDPIASLRDSRMKDIEKGRGIRRQKALFEALLTLRITFQKALSSSTSVPSALPADPAGELAQKRIDILKSLGDLNDRMFILRESLNLSGAGAAPGADTAEKAALGKRKREGEGDSGSAEYWMESAQQSLALSDAAHLHLLPVLNKWSSKIQAASLQLGSKQAGGSKFLQTIKSGAGGIVEAIETGLTNKRDSEKTLMENEESSYRALLREVIESRSGSSGPAADLTHLRREKKKKREAERGGSKGRKLRYTVHEKAQNFIVPIPLRGGWHEEQVDELFSSLFGGVGMQGAVAENRVEVDAGVDGEGLSGLGGLRVF
ncbi:protein BFR2 [Kwoniella heveanensis BCC8398]|uniref:Protein BFR2 n=1 Tax=Kwoniella heveanensis BCC8398 TaxID=1296120 RepID=A0A1B9GT28_9TREE|nr:protein BFR2 [Kwoniella heveanensis BCC8398]